jgi:hypothetical protein
VKVCGVDLAGVGNSSTGGSYHALVSVLFNAIDGNIYVIDCERARNLTREQLVAMVTHHLARNNPDLTVIEEASSGGYVAGLLQRTTRYPLRMVQPKTSKEERALQVIGLAEGGKIHLPMRSTWGDMLRAEIAENRCILGRRASDGWIDECQILERYTTNIVVTSSVSLDVEDVTQVSVKIFNQ